ncbi:AraC family transcriptional regulator [Gordonia iterans]|uniref:AraC family transcriptional regulator n=1 Tax=Gordonia iterans TaxID=1004901 RepID=A0A2S0KKG4_9ACTN|nr:AraC family transcriptional regulator [Gordonia iterans]AVM02178.1 AraC family transcriptional regulator [Gordonia iterans]
MTRVPPVPFPAWEGVLAMVPGAVFYRGPGGDADSHAHHAIQIIASLDGPFTLSFDQHRERATAALIPSGVRHGLTCSSGRLLIVLVDPFGPRGRRLEAAAGRMTTRQVGRALAPVLADSGAAPDPGSAVDEFIGALAPDSPDKVSVLSDPVRAALQYLEGAAHAGPRLAEAAAQAHLSPSHLTHLFSREVGMPFRRYGIWVRLRRAAEQVAAGATLTDAAVAAGFSDSAHLSRVFKANFGLSPSALLAMAVRRDAWPEAVTDADTRGW